LTAFDLGFTGNFSSLSIQYTYTGAVSTGLVRVHHWNGSTWVMLSAVVDTNARTITFSVNSLSPFIIGVLQDTKPTGFDIVQFIQDNWIYLLIGLGIVIGVSAAVSARRKKVSKAKAKTKAPPGKKSSKKSMDYVDAGTKGTETTARGKQPVDQPAWVQPMVSETKDTSVPTKELGHPLRFYCQACIQYQDMPDAHLGTRYDCPSCKQELARVLKCPLCAKGFAVSQESAQSHEGAMVDCPGCKQKFKLSSTPLLDVGERINLFCPTCQAWSPQPAVQRVVGQEKCSKCGGLYFVVTKCTGCNSDGIIPVDKFNEFRANPSRCGKCNAVLKVQ
jgi:hypothetical protein